MTKMTMMRFILVGILLVSVSETFGQNTYIVTMPATLRPAFPSDVVVNFLTPVTKVDVTVSLQGQKNYSKSASFTDRNGRVSITLPADFPGGTYTVVVEGKGGNINFRNTSSVEVERKNLILMVQTDKALYKPGQTVMYRVIAAKPDLKPYVGDVMIEIMDPLGNKVKRFTVSNPPKGLVSQNILLSDFAFKGDWNIQVTAGDQSVKKSFTVDEYVLPKFEVTINAPSFILTTDKTITGTVEAKYTYGKGVEGHADVVVEFPSYYLGVYDNRGGDYMRRIKQSLNINGKGQFQIDLSQLATQNGMMYQGSLTLRANVTETLTGVTLSTKDDVIVSIQTSPIDIQFHESNAKNYKPGMKYSAYLSVKKRDGTLLGAPRSMLSVGYTFYGTDYTQNNPKKSVSLTIPDTGMVLFEVDTPVNTTSLSLEYMYGTDQNSRSSYSLNSATSPSSSFLQILSGGKTPMAGQDITFTVRATQSNMLLYYEAIGRGTVRVSNTMQMTGASSSLTITTTSDMAPTARLVVFYIRNDGEVVVDALNFNVDGAFKNNVSMSFGSAEVLPGDNVSISLKASPGSTVAILAVDQSVLLLKSGNDITQSQVIDELGTFDTTKNSNSINPWGGGGIVVDGPIARGKRSLWMPWPWFYGGSTAQDIFDNAGMLVLTDTFVYSSGRYGGPVLFAPGFGGGVNNDAMRPQAGLAPGSGAPTSSQPVRTRKLFPETWLWNEMTSSADGTFTFQQTVPDTISSWVASAFAISDVDGFGVAPNQAKLRVFQPFFISLNLPYSITRGEQVGLQVTVFNYFDTDLSKVMLTLKQSDEYDVISFQTNNSIVENVTPMKKDMTVQLDNIPAQGGKSISFPIVPRKLGLITLKVTATAPQAGDSVEKTLLVKPEGVEQAVNQPVIIDLQTKTSFDLTVNTALPSAVINGSDRMRISVFGDLLGPSVEGLDRLITVPCGCGEQNMITLVPNIVVGRYLKAMNQFSGDLKSKAIKNMETGYQRELTYMHTTTDMGGYSAFGDDTTGTRASSWLTAFVVRSFRQAQDFIYVDPAVQDKSIAWLKTQQSKDGSFLEPGKVIHSDMQGGATSSVTITAYILIALVEKQTTNLQSLGLQTTVTAATGFLEKNLDSLTDPYPLAIVSYALQLTKSSRANDAFNKLKALATTTSDSMYWAGKKDATTPPPGDWYTPRPVSNDIEMTSYALLTYMDRGSVTDALPIAKWLVSKRNSLGGYDSTQDTVLALQALSEFASKVFSASSLNVAITITVNGIQKQFTVDSTNAFLMQSWELTTSAPSVRVQATGKGIALVQVSSSFNLPFNSLNTPLQIQVTIEKDTVDFIQVRTCAKCNTATGMALMEVPAPNGFAVQDDYLQNLVDKGSVRSLQRADIQDNTVVLYFDKMDQTDTCVSLPMERASSVAKPVAVYATVADYYSPGNKQRAKIQSKTMQSASICDTCKDCVGCEGVTGKTAGAGSNAAMLSHLLVLAIAMLSALFMSSL